MSESKVIKARIAKVSPYKPENGINRFRILIDYRLESSPSRRRIFSQVVKAKNIVLAQEHAETLRYEVKKGQHVPFEEETEELPVIKTKALTLEEAYPEYEKRMKDRGRQELTIFNTKRLFELHIFPVLGNYPVDDIDGNAINETLKTSLNRKIANGEITKRTAKFFMARLKSCLQTLHVKGLRAKPCPPIETFGKDEDKALSPYKNKVISEEQFQAALNLAHQLGPVYVVFLLLGGHCGLRLGEIMGLAWEHVHFRPSKAYPYGYLKVCQQLDGRGKLRDCKGGPKGTTDLEVPLSKAAHEALQLLQSSQPKGTKMVITVERKQLRYNGITLTSYPRGQDRKSVVWGVPWRNDVLQWCHALLGHGNSHSLRHYAITHLINKGAPLKAVSNFARHAKIETTLGYLTSSKEELGAAITKAFD